MYEPADDIFIALIICVIFSLLVVSCSGEDEQTTEVVTITTDKGEYNIEKFGPDAELTDLQLKDKVLAAELAAAIPSEPETEEAEQLVKIEAEINALQGEDQGGYSDPMEAEIAALRLRAEAEELKARIWQQQVNFKADQMKKEHELEMMRLKMKAERDLLASQSAQEVAQTVQPTAQPQQEQATSLWNSIEVIGVPSCFQGLCKAEVLRNGSKAIEFLKESLRPVKGDVFKEACVLTTTGKKECEMYSQVETITVGV